MTQRHLTFVGVLAAVLAVVWPAAGAIAGQTPTVAKAKVAAAAKTKHPPRTSWGDPDLQGVWVYQSATPLERPSALAGKVVLTDEEQDEIDAQVGRASSRDRRDGTAEADVARAYNEFWWERGKSTGRTSLIVDPPDGRVPPMTEEAKKREAAPYGTYYNADRTNRADSWLDRSLWERCITAGLPRIGGGSYNSNVQILQTPEYVVMHLERIHDARIIPLDGRPHISRNARLWHGDPRGRWEGNTLVVETTNFSPKTNFRGSRENLHLVERFTRVDAGTLNYEVTLDDPTTWTKPWTAAVPWMPPTAVFGAQMNELFEYACHEGNHGLSGILSGARAQERAAAEAAQKGSK